MNIIQETNNMHEIYHVIMRGLSSLLFIVSAYEAYNVSDMIMWKISNMILVISSFLCNVYPIPKYMLFDYLTIILICISYINNLYINIIILFVLAYEYITYKTVTSTRNLVVILAILYLFYKTYYTSIENFEIIMGMLILGLCVWYLRNKIYYIWHINVVTCCTFMWHYLAMVILCIASHTTLSSVNVTLSAKTHILILSIGFFCIFIYSLADTF
jgi:hypothetical protein